MIAGDNFFALIQYEPVACHSKIHLNPLENLIHPNVAVKGAQIVFMMCMVPYLILLFKGSLQIREKIGAISEGYNSMENKEEQSLGFGSNRFVCQNYQHSR